jgi:hypothetical protein
LWLEGIHRLFVCSNIPALLISNRNFYQLKHGLILGGDVLSSKHRMFKKNFETEMHVNNLRLPLNHFTQETLANVMIGFLKTLKEVGEQAPTTIEITIKKLPKPVEVDAHTYP